MDESDETRGENSSAGPAENSGFRNSSVSTVCAGDATTSFGYFRSVYMTPELSRGISRKYVNCTTQCNFRNPATPR